MDGRQEKLMELLRSHYLQNGKYQMTDVTQRNIMLIGRTSTGKSTIIQLLLDPTVISNELSFISSGQDSSIESFHIRDKSMVLNIIDTPGLFEHGLTALAIRDNATILHTIETCVNREITKIHVLCFCVSILAGIKHEDFESMKMLRNSFGNEISRNSCLVITGCESKDESERAMIRTELSKDEYFNEIIPFFGLGIFFSGALNRNDYIVGSCQLVHQYHTISDYRVKLIELFTSNVEPISISETLISYVRRARDETTRKDYQLRALQAEVDDQAQIIEQLRVARLNNLSDTSIIIGRLLATNLSKYKEYNYHSSEDQNITCSIS